MKVLVLIMSCEVGDYPKLIEKQHRTWDSITRLEVQTLYYYAGQTTEIIGDKLFVDTKEGHGYFYIKTMLAFKKALELEWDYIFKSDNSAYIDKAQLVKTLRDKPREGYYGGHLYKTTYVKSDPFFWGEGFALSRDVVKYLVDSYEISSIGRSGVEDVHIGMLLNEPFNKEVNWDPSLMVHEYYKHELSPNHVYRCKNDDSKEDLQDQLTAMDNIHAFFHPEFLPDR